MLAKKCYPEKDIWCYTGYLLEDLMGLSILDRIDVLVDGPFVAEQKSLRLRFRGSENQRIIDVKPSLAAGKVVLWNGGSD